MKKFALLITCISACLILGSCTKDSKNVTSPKDYIPVTMANLSGKWTLVSDTTTQLASIMATTPTEGINYIGKAVDYYEFTSYGKLNFHNNSVTGAETYKLSHDTVLVEYPYTDGRTNQVDSAYSPIYVVAQLGAHFCVLTEHDTGPELDSYSTINLSR